MKQPSGSLGSILTDVWDDVVVVEPEVEWCRFTDSVSCPAGWSSSTISMFLGRYWCSSTAGTGVSRPTSDADVCDEGDRCRLFLNPYRGRKFLACGGGEGGEIVRWDEVG